MQASLHGKSHRAASFTDSKMISQEAKPMRSSSINLSSNLPVYNAPQSFASISNKIFNDLSQAIQLVQKSFLEKNSQDKKMTNSDYQVHELCQQFDYVFLLGLRNRDEGYWKVVLEFTHKDVLKELKKLLNVNTNIGRGRAWIYHALNENLMESYLRCFLDNKKLVSKFYSPGVSLVSDEQSLSVLVTLVSGLENVEFKLFSDVPYLDHCCWPSHLKLKRQVIDQILNSPTHTLTQKMVDLNKSLMEASMNLSQSHPKEKAKHRPANNVSISEDNSNGTIVKPKVKIKKKPRKPVSMDALSNDEISSSEQIDSEIDKLRKENSKILERQASEKVISKSCVPNDLAARSLTASSQFDSKIEHIETYSKIIENATMNMDAFVKDMSDVYQNYEKFYQSNEVDQDLSTEVENENKINSVYDDSVNKSIDLAESNDSSEKDNRNVLFFSSSLSSLHTNNTNLDETRSNSKDDKDHYSVDSKVENENNYLDDTNCMEDLRQDIRVDNNTKLLLSLEILQNGSNEDILKLYQCTRGHCQGEIESIFLLITTYGLYILKNQQSNEFQSEINVQNAIKYEKELFMSHEQIDYIEVSLGDQSVHFVCFNKRSNLWITTASRILTNNLLENLQTSRIQNKFLKFTKVPVFHEATQQKLALKKFLSSEENAQPQDIGINGYSLVFWEDQASAINQIIHKEGMLYYFLKSNNTNLSTAEWKKAFFVLKNDVLTKYKNQGDRRPLQVIKLDGEEFSGCRKYNKMSRPHTIELIFANSHLYLSAKNEEEASDWIQSFCKIISLGNYQSTDVPTLSCLPCCAVTTSKKLYFCHEDLVTGFYRLLETIKLEEINRVSFDNDNPFYCILHDDTDSSKMRYWFVYFIDRNERNEFVTYFKKAWEEVFQVQLTVEKLKNIEMRKRCIKGVKMIHKSLENSIDLN
ncbi:pleckstrin homology domain-containing family M member [Brachionus plicatilis]|uniref:Pleckstrin homology domain-containing family M member n=1 Tax=Brachionus plicatilis TaxID=10195 RepID=A0A3M7S6U1_BRAPC|nr:pleckstrin homology domain-containing family M member [Brachionus plicatilis]